jgi:hypothetical protein
VRGDSLRDLYAKALALFGLALLAAVGALFDYWPIANELPVIARLKSPALTDVAGPGAPAGGPAISPVPLMARGRAAVVTPVTTPAAPVPAPAITLTMAPVFALSVGPSRLDFGTAVKFAPVTMPLTDETGLGTAISASTPPEAIVVEMMPMDPPVRAEDDGSAVGAVTDALKKTGQTIAKTGARTGASIRDALVSFGGAFRKIL